MSLGQSTGMQGRKAGSWETAEIVGEDEVGDAAFTLQQILLTIVRNNFRLVDQMQSSTGRHKT